MYYCTVLRLNNYCTTVLYSALITTVLLYCLYSVLSVMYCLTNYLQACTLLYCTGLDYTDYTILYTKVLYCTLLYSTVKYSVYCTVLHCSVHRSILSCTTIELKAHLCAVWAEPAKVSTGFYKVALFPLVLKCTTSSWGGPLILAKASFAL